MAIHSDGPKPVDVNALFQQASAGKGGGGDGSSKDFLEQIADGVGSPRLLKKVGVDTKIGEIGFKHYDSKGLLEGPINKMAASLNVRGGALMEFISKHFQFASINDFKNLIKPAIEGLSPDVMFAMHNSTQNMSFASLGDLSPSSVGGEMGRGGFEMSA